MYVTCGDVQLKRQLDISAEVSILNIDDYQRLKPTKPFQPGRRKLRTYDGKTIKLIGPSDGFFFRLTIT